MRTHAAAAAGISLAPLLLMSACSSSGWDGGRLTDGAVIEFRLGDSAPPPHNRSYELTITVDQVHAFVHSHGDPVAEATEALPSEVWDHLAENAGAVADIEPDVAEDCVGGHALALVISDGGEALVDLGLACEDDETARPRLWNYIQPARDVIPNWSELVAIE
jgi:hypothetical protein